MVYVTWTADDFHNDEIDIPTEEGARTIGITLDARMLWNKVDIAFEIRKPASKAPQPSSPQLGGRSDDDNNNSGSDNGGDGMSNQ